MGKPKEFKMPKGKILMGKKTPAPKKKTGNYQASTQEIVYPSGTPKKGYVTGSKRGNTLRTSVQSFGVQGGERVGGTTKYETYTTTLGKDGRRESVVKTSGRNLSNQKVVSETQLNRGSGTRKTGAKKKAY
jgi:hypothetical protein